MRSDLALLVQVVVLDLARGDETRGIQDEVGRQLFLTHLREVRSVGAVVAANDEEQIHLHVEQFAQRILPFLRSAANRVEEAEVELEQAIALEGDRSAAYCLLAQVKEQQGEKKQAVSHWENCLAYTHLPRTPEEDKWIRLGQQRLKAAYGEMK